MLEVTALNAGYGRSQVLAGIELSIDYPRVVSVLGRNGAGKTTLLKSILGYVRPDSGRISFQGKEITRFSPDRVVRLGIGYVPQEGAIFSSLTVRENLQVGAGARRASTVRTDDVLDLFPRLAERLWQRAGTLSGGERKMLAMARALLADPTLLILDEPTEGVWPAVIAELEARLAELGQRRSILLVEQHVPMALRLAHYVYVLDRGQVVLHGPSQEVAASADLYRYLAP